MTLPGPLARRPSRWSGPILTALLLQGRYLLTTKRLRNNAPVPTDDDVRRHLFIKLLVASDVLNEGVPR